MKFYQIIKTPIGELLIVETNNYITNIEIGPFNLDKMIEEETKTIKEMKKWLFDYFKGINKPIPKIIKQNKTSFQNDVYEATMKIPFGETKTYKQIAESINRPKAYRAVGNALNKNDLLIVMPCHRVLSSRGLGGFGSGIDNKIILLNHEQSYKSK